MIMGMKYQKQSTKKIGLAASRFKQHFCFMWKREFGNMPTEWIIKDYLKSLTERHSTSSSLNPDKDVSEFTIHYIDDYMPKQD